MTPPQMTRRNALLALVASAALPALPRRALAAATSDRWERVAQRLRRLVPPRQSARRIGLAYAASCPAEADPGVAARRLVGSLDVAPEALLAQDDVTLRRMLEERRRDDFATGATVTVDGWILARSEARLCALF